MRISENKCIRINLLQQGALRHVYFRRTLVPYQADTFYGVTGPCILVS